MSYNRFCNVPYKQLWSSLKIHVKLNFFADFCQVHHADLDFPNRYHVMNNLFTHTQIIDLLLKFQRQNSQRKSSGTRLFFLCIVTNHCPKIMNLYIIDLVKVSEEIALHLILKIPQLGLHRPDNAINFLHSEIC